MNIYDVVEKQRAALLAKEYQTVKGIVRAYEVAERRVEASIRQFQAKIKAAQNAGLEPSLAWYYQEARLENILREIRMHLDEFSKDALEFAEKGRSDAYELGAVHALRLAEAQVYGDIAGLNAGAFTNAQALLSAASPLKVLFDEIGPTAAVKAREVFAEGIAAGWNPRKMGRVLANEIEGLAKRRAILIARTEQIRAYRTANADVYKRNADVLRGWRWTAAKTPATCAMCLALDGEIFPVDQVLSSHPACRCSMLPLPRTDFGGPQPTLGEDYFAKLSEEEQDRILGKGKAKMYREGKITLKDNVRWKDSPEWGRQPSPRSLSWLRDRYISNSLPSQRGFLKVSPFEPIPARKLSDLLIDAEKKASDPKKKALDAWNAKKLYPSGNRAIDFRRVKAPYKKYVKSLDGLDSIIEEVDLKALVSTLPSAPHQKVVAYINSLGDGVDLPVVFRQGSNLYIHNGESLARLQAKVLLGQTKASVRIFDADLLTIAKSPVNEAMEALKSLGVKNVKVLNGDEAEVLRALEWARERLSTTGVVPKEVIVSKGARGVVTPSGEFIVGTDLSDLVVEPIEKAIYKSSLIAETPQNQLKAINEKAKLVRTSLDQKENVEAGLLRTKFTYDKTSATSKLLTEWGTKRYDLLSLRAFEAGRIEDALEEAIILYRRGEYRLGSLPEAIEKPFLKQAQTILGKKKTLAPYSDEENFLMLKIGGQGGTNPGGMYVGKDGITRYIKFYDNPERALVENVANAIYAKHGIAVPKSTVFDHAGKKVLATEFVDGKTIEALGGIKSLDKKVLEDAFEGYMLDAFLANWDVVGLKADNMVVVGRKVYRVDNGGTFIFRAQGGYKHEHVLLSFEEFYSLGGTTAKGDIGQFKPILARLGYNSVEEAIKPLKAQAKALVKTLDKIAKTEADWIKFFDATSPGLSNISKKKMAAMMLKRRALIDEKILELEAVTNAAKMIGKDKATREAALQKGRKPLTQAQFEKIVKSKPASFVIKSRTTDEYDAWLAAHTDEAFENMDEEARAAAVLYSTSAYEPVFNGPQRQLRKYGTPIPLEKQRQINALNRAIAANKKGLDADIMVSRKLDGSATEAKWHKFTDLDVGTVISDSAFQSTAMRPDVWRGDVHLRITLRKGERRFIPPGRRAHDGAHPNEVELILAPNLLYVIQKVEHHGSHVVIYVEVIPEGYTVPKGKLIRYSLRSLFARKPKDIGPNIPTKIGGTVHDSGIIDPVTVLRHSLCANCSRKLPGVAACDAFREGIPVGILVGAVDHRKELPGDLGLVFEPRDPTEEIDLDL